MVKLIHAYVAYCKSLLGWPRRGRRGIVVISWALFISLCLSLVGRTHKTEDKNNDDILSYIDPLIGSSGPGHVFGGATLPFGSIQVAWDSATDVDAPQGYVSDDSPVTGISHLHHSGTGGARSMGQFQIFPLLCSSQRIDECLIPLGKERAFPKLPGSTKASPGYFSLCLTNGICSESVVTPHAAAHRFLAGSTAGHNQSLVLVFDPTSDLSDTYQEGRLIGIDQPEGALRIRTSGVWKPSFADGEFTVFSCLSVKSSDDPIVRMFVNQTRSDIPSRPNKHMEKNTAFAIRLDHYNDVRLAISWKSSEQACAFLDKEAPHSVAFANVRARAEETWRSELAVIHPSDRNVSHDTLRLFYSSLYRTIMSPRNATDDKPSHISAVGNQMLFDDFYCIWDTFRSVHPLVSILWPQYQADIVQGLLNIAEAEGYLPDCRMGFNKGYMQGGSNADSLLADSLLKLDRKPAEQIDWDKALKAIRKDAEVAPPDWGLEGRGHIEHRSWHGYVPANPNGTAFQPRSVFGRSASRTIEYTFNDFSISVVAHHLKEDAIKADYLKASSDWKNLWDTSVTQDGYTGFIQPRLANGEFLHYSDPRRCAPVFKPHECYLVVSEPISHFYESNAWEYSFVAALHDVRSVIDFMGGDFTFLRRLDHAWDQRYLDIGNEPAMIIPYLSNFALGGYRHTVDRLHQLKANFTTAFDGLPGNDDQGSLAAFVVFQHLGFYPLASTTIYLFGVPRFPEFVVGKVRFTCENFNGAKKQYIVSALLDGRPYRLNWFSHSLFFTGGHFTLTLGEEPSGFGEGLEDLPPSLSETGGFERLIT